MVGDEQRLDLVDQRAQPGEVRAVEPVGRTDRHRDAVQRDRIKIAHVAQNLAGLAAIDHENFRNHLDEIDRDAGFEEIGIMRLAQAEAKAVKGVGHRWGVLKDARPLVRLLICDELRMQKYDVVEAFDALEAMAILNSGVRIDLILTDVRMPGEIDGLGLLTFARDNYPLIPVIVTSGHLLPEEVLKDGAARFLPKLYTFPRAIVLIEEVLKTPL